jgi:1,4-alpha-glucan branching enzyme
MTWSREQAAARSPQSLLSEDDIFWFNEGTHRRLGDKLGAHILRTSTAGSDGAGPPGTAYFAVWAPGATAVSVIGDFNRWDREAAPMAPRASSGIWELVLDGVLEGQVYKFAVTAASGRVTEKADPFAFFSEVPPRTGSVLWDIAYDWGDGEWMSARAHRNSLAAPVSIYEVHLGSWMRPEDDPARLYGYREIAPRLVSHVLDTGFTHVELLPVMEHPFYGSWGYQVTGYFAPTSRYGTPQDLMALVDELHQAGIGVVLDWVPSHFPADTFGLASFDGTHLFEHADPRRGYHRDWNSLIFNYGRHEVRSFLASSAEHWLSKYHADGLRVDAVASMLYRDYSRPEGEWIPNEFGGREDFEAVEFLRRLNIGIYEDHPDVQTVAEESTAWPAVSRPADAGGLGFGMKWDMGWMHDTLHYLSQDPVHRRWQHGELTFRAVYAFTENFVLPLSHDEVVHGKGSLLAKMPGDDWQRFANLRLLYGYQWALPGKKLLFMGDELASPREWNHDAGLDWSLLERPLHRGVERFVRDLNRCLRSQPALYELDTEPAGFEWVEPGADETSVLAFIRRGNDGQAVLALCNFTPVPRYGLRLGVPDGGRWDELVNSDASDYGGSGIGNFGAVVAEQVASHGLPWSLVVTAPPLSCVLFARASR